MDYLLTASALLDERDNSSDDSSEYDDDSWDPTSWIRKKAKGTPDDPTDPDYQPELTRGKKFRTVQSARADAVLLPRYAEHEDAYPSSSKRYSHVEPIEEPPRKLYATKRKFEAAHSAHMEPLTMQPGETFESVLRRYADYGYEEPVTPPFKKQGRLNPVWTKEAIDSLLQLRYQMYATFEDDEPAVIARGWYKIASMLDPFPCTPEDCRVKFDSLCRAYFKMLKNMQMGAWHDPNEFRRLQYIERIFDKSPKTAEDYAKAHSQFSERMEEESLPEPKTLLEYVNRYNFMLGSLFRFVIKDRQKREEQEKQFEDLFNDFTRLREKKRALSAEFVRKIVEALSRPDAMTETFHLMCKVYIALIDRDCWTLVNEFRRIIAVQNERFENVALMLSYFSRWVTVLIEADPSDEECFIKLLPDSNKCLTKIITPPIEIQPTLADYSFKGQLNMNRTSVEKLIEMVAPFITVCHAYSKRISIERQVILSLWYLVHIETVEQLSIRFSIRFMDVSKIIQYFCTVVSDKCSLLEWPGAHELKQIVLGFENLSVNAFPGVAGALGAKYIYAKPPAGLQRAAPATICLQGVADTNFIFTDLFVSTINDEKICRSDSYQPPLETELPSEYRQLDQREVFRTSPLWRKLNPRGASGSNSKHTVRLLWDEIHVVSDFTHPLLKTVMVPFNDDDKASLQTHGLFDSRLNQARCFIEIAFGKALSRYHRLFALDYTVNKNITLIKTVFCLHNLCMREGDDFTPSLKISFPETVFFPKMLSSPEAMEKRNAIMEALSRGFSPFIFRQVSTAEKDQKGS